jgi:hypothetical protein
MSSDDRDWGRQAGPRPRMDEATREVMARVFAALKTRAGSALARGSMSCNSSADPARRGVALGPLVGEYSADDLRAVEAVAGVASVRVHAAEHGPSRLILDIEPAREREDADPDGDAVAQGLREALEARREEDGEPMPTRPRKRARTGSA